MSQCQKEKNNDAIDNNAAIMEPGIHEIENAVIEAHPFHDIDLQAQRKKAGRNKESRNPALMFMDDEKAQWHPQKINPLID